MHSWDFQKMKTPKFCLIESRICMCFDSQSVRFVWLLLNKESLVLIFRINFSGSKGMKPRLRHKSSILRPVSGSGDWLIRMWECKRFVSCLGEKEFTFACWIDGCSLGWLCWQFFMKIHESAWIILESHIWTGKSIVAIRNWKRIKGFYVFCIEWWLRVKNYWKKWKEKNSALIPLLRLDQLLLREELLLG